MHNDGELDAVGDVELRWQARHVRFDHRLARERLDRHWPRSGRRTIWRSSAEDGVILGRARTSSVC